MPSCRYTFRKGKTKRNPPKPQSLYLPAAGATPLREILRRLELPPVDLMPTDREGERLYFAALHAGDQNDWTPLMKVWESRFEQFTDSTP